MILGEEVFLNFSIKSQCGLSSRCPWWDLVGKAVLFLTPALHLLFLSVWFAIRITAAVMFTDQNFKTIDLRPCNVRDFSSWCWILQFLNVLASKSRTYSATGRKKYAVSSLCWPDLRGIFQFPHPVETWCQPLISAFSPDCPGKDGDVELVTLF